MSAQPEAAKEKHVPAKADDKAAVRATPKKDESLHALLVEIFEVTGHKVTLDDPVVAAALLQSKLLRRAGDDAAVSLREAVVKVVAELAEAVRVERETAANLDRTVASAFQQITEGAKKAGDQELATMQTRFARVATETLDQVRREAASLAPGGRWWRYSATLLAGLALGLAVGVVIGKSRSPQINQEQIRLMHNGMLLDAAWPKLPKAARDVLEAVGRPDAKPLAVDASAKKDK
jgi:hypothetical protein